jgi:uncharacterized YccA/Bax inhibitor family protein
MPSNPVLTKLESSSRPGSATLERPATFKPDLTKQDPRQGFPGPAYGSPPPPPVGGSGGGGWGGGGGAPSRYMTLDDVVQRTGAMLVVLFAFGALAWLLAPTGISTGLLIIGAMGGLGLGLYMSFTMKAKASTALAYSALEGLFLGAISRAFESLYPGIVIQAVIGTVMVAGGMLLVYRTGAIRVTPRFTRVVIGATIGVFGLMLVNLIAYLFTPGGLGLRDANHPAIAIIFSLLCIVVASFNLVLDFDMIERAIQRGADERFAWYASFGLMVTLVWLYLEILRLIGYLRQS